MTRTHEPTTWLYSETEIKSAVVQAAEQLRIGHRRTVSSFTPIMSVSALHAAVRQFRTELITCEQQDIEVRSELIEAERNGSLARIDIICTRKEP